MLCDATPHGSLLPSASADARCIDDVIAIEGFNPQSERFSPFTFSPRDCLGKNFAQMEMRTIMASVFRKFKFTLSAPYAQWDFEKDGPLENFQGTMGPVSNPPPPPPLSNRESARGR